MEQTIYKKMIEARKNFEKVLKTEEAHKYKYANIATICEAIDTHLYDAGLGYFHRSGYEMLGNECVEFIAFVVFDEHGEIELSRKMFSGYEGHNNVYQNMGSASTYLRRYTMLEGFGIAVEDDDAQSLTGKKRPQRKQNIAGLASFEQVQSIVGASKLLTHDEKMELSQWKIDNNISTIKHGEFLDADVQKCLDEIQRIIDSRVEIVSGEIVDISDTDVLGPDDMMGLFDE